MDNWLNNGGWMPNQSPMMPQQMSFQPPAPKYQITKVKGFESAKNFRMAPYSETLLLDETSPIIWYAQTDGTGFLTVTPFDISPHQEKAPVDLNDLSNRVSQLEEYIKNVQQSNFTNTKPRKQQQQRTSTDTTGQNADAAIQNK